MSSWVTFNKVAPVALAIFAASSANAAVGWVKGTVEFIRSHDSQNSGWEPPNSWFTLTGVTSAAGCQTWNGRILFVLHDQQGLALVLSAMKGGNVIAVNYDDSKATNGYCDALYTTIRSPTAADVN